MWRTGQCGTRPNACVNRKRCHLPAFADRNDEQVERDAPMDIGDPIGFDHHQVTSVILVKPGKRTIV